MLLHDLGTMYNWQPQNRVQIIIEKTYYYNVIIFNKVENISYNSRLNINIIKMSLLFRCADNLVENDSYSRQHNTKFMYLCNQKKILSFRKFGLYEDPL